MTSYSMSRRGQNRPATTPDATPAQMRDLLAAIDAALAAPRPAAGYWPEHHRLLANRARAVRGCLAGADHIPPERLAAAIRRQTRELPVDYPLPGAVPL